MGRSHHQVYQKPKRRIEIQYYCYIFIAYVILLFGSWSLRLNPPSKNT